MKRERCPLLVDLPDINRKPKNVHLFSRASLVKHFRNASAVTSRLVFEAFLQIFFRICWNRKMMFFLNSKWLIYLSLRSDCAKNERFFFFECVQSLSHTGKHLKDTPSWGAFFSCLHPPGSFTKGSTFFNWAKLTFNALTTKILFLLKICSFPNLPKYFLWGKINTINNFRTLSSWKDCNIDEKRKIKDLVVEGIFNGTRLSSILLFDWFYLQRLYIWIWNNYVYLSIVLVGKKLLFIGGFHVTS